MSAHPNPRMLTGKTWACRLGNHDWQLLWHTNTSLIPDDGEYHKLVDYGTRVGTFCRRCGKERG